MTFNAYEIIRRAVEEGTAHGVRRGLEYFPDDVVERQEALKERVEQEIMNALCEVIDFSQGEELP